MEATTRNHYHMLRRIDVPAGEALRRAKCYTEQEKYRAEVTAEWDALLGHGYWENSHGQEDGQYVRLRVEPDDCTSFEDLAGDCFDPVVNPDVPADLLREQLEQFRDRLNNDGVWVLIGEYWDGDCWQLADCCGGFVGDDYNGSGYDVDIMAATISAFNALEFCPCCGRPVVK